MNFHSSPPKSNQQLVDITLNRQQLKDIKQSSLTFLNNPQHYQTASNTFLRRRIITLGSKQKTILITHSLQHQTRNIPLSKEELICYQSRPFNRILICIICFFISLTFDKLLKNKINDE